MLPRSSLPRCLLLRCPTPGMPSGPGLYLAEGFHGYRHNSVSGSRPWWWALRRTGRHCGANIVPAPPRGTAAMLRQRRHIEI